MSAKVAPSVEQALANALSGKPTAVEPVLTRKLTTTIVVSVQQSVPPAKLVPTELAELPVAQQDKCFATEFVPTLLRATITAVFAAMLVRRDRNVAPVAVERPQQTPNTVEPVPRHVLGVKLARVVPVPVHLVKLFATMCAPIHRPTLATAVAAAKSATLAKCASAEAVLSCAALVKPTALVLAMIR